jgi:WD40 repeat protein
MLHLLHVVASLSLVLPQKDGAAPAALPAPRTIAECGTAIAHIAVDAAGDVLVLATTKGELRAWSIEKEAFLWTLAPSNGLDGKPSAVLGLAVGQKLAMHTGFIAAPESVDLRKGTTTSQHMLIGRKPDGTSATPVGLTCDPKDRWAWLALREGRVVRYTPGVPAAYNSRALEGAVLTSIASDGDQSLAVGCEDGSIRFVNASSAELDEKKVFRAHTTPITALAFGGKSAPLVSASKDGTVHAWNVSTGKSRVDWKCGEMAVRAIAVHPKGKWAMTGDESGALAAWSLDKGDRIAEIPSEAGKATTELLWIDGGKKLVAARSGTCVQVYDVSKL